jgi:hypothetical protein
MSAPGPRQPLDSVNVAQLVAVSLRLAMEIGVLRDRLRTHERLLAQHGLLDPLSVDTFVPDAAEQTVRVSAHRALIEAVGHDVLSPGEPFT